MKKSLILAAMAGFCTWSAAGSITVSVIDKEGKPVQDAVVVALPANKSVLPKVALSPQATIVQEKMQFVPAVTLVPAGSKVRFVNNDSWDHHVRSSPAGMGQFNSTNAGFELRLEGKSDGKPAAFTDVTLDKAGIVGSTLLGCFIHGSMRGYIYVSESPWALKTNAEGIATFEDLPDGAAQIKVWQADQLFDLATQQAVVSPTPGKNLFKLSVIPRRRRG
jgi:plastocyanin